MAKIERVLQKIFGSSAASGEFGVIGSKASGSPTNTKDLAAIQTDPKYLEGLIGITSDQGVSRLPYTEDMNSLFFLTTSMLRYLYQSGVPEWLSTENYYANVSIVLDDGELWKCTEGSDLVPNVGLKPSINKGKWVLLANVGILPSVDRLRTIVGQYEGQNVQLTGYYENIPLGGIPMYFWDESSALEDNGGSVIKPTVTIGNGRWVWRGITTVNVKWFGIKYSSVYSLADGQLNRKQIEQASRSFGTVILPPGEANEKLYITGSIHPNKSNVVVHQEKGCNIVGYVENALISAGHLWGFVMYQDPDNGDFTIVGTIENITYVLDGDIITKFSPTDDYGTFNHNGIGFFDCYNCQIIGNGGVSQCNHKGLNFDGEADRCVIDINYVINCSTINISFKGSDESTNTIKAKYLFNNLFNSTNQADSRSSLFLRGGWMIIDVDYIEDTIGRPVVNLQGITREAYIKLGVVKGNGAHLVRMYSSKAVTIERCNYSNLDSIVAIAGSNLIQTDILLNNITCSDNSVINTTKIISREVVPPLFERLVIKYCDFSEITTMTSLTDGLIVPYFDLSDTKMPTTFNYFLYTPYIKSKSVANYNDASFVVDSNDKYGVLRMVSLSMVVTSATGPRYQADIDLLTLQNSTTPTYKIYIDPIVGYVDITRSGSVFTFTAPGGFRFADAAAKYI